MNKMLLAVIQKIENPYQRKKTQPTLHQIHLPFSQASFGQDSGSNPYLKSLEVPGSSPYLKSLEVPGSNPYLKSFEVPGNSPYLKSLEVAIKDTFLL